MTVDSARPKAAETSAWLAVAMRLPAPVLARQFQRAMETSRKAVGETGHFAVGPGRTKVMSTERPTELLAPRNNPRLAGIGAGTARQSMVGVNKATVTAVPTSLYVGQRRTLASTAIGYSPDLHALYQRIAVLARKMALRDSKVQFEPAQFPGTRVSIAPAADGWRVDVHTADADTATAFAKGGEALAELFDSACLGAVQLTVSGVDRE